MDRKNRSWLRCAPGPQDAAHLFDLLLSPPFGYSLFYLKSVAPKEIEMRQIWSAVTPYVVMGLIALVAVMLIPGLATWLPRKLLS